MKKNIIILTLIFLIVILIFVFFIRENLHVMELKKLNESMLRKEHVYEITLVDFIVTYDRLFKNYQELYSSYQKQAILLKEQEALNAQLAGNWTPFEVTSYSQESGTITSIGIDLKANYARYLSIAAVDPEVVPYGSTLLIKFSDGSIKPFIAADTGGLIKGNRIDLLFSNKDEAINFGKIIKDVRIIK